MYFRDKAFLRDVVASAFFQSVASLFILLTDCFTEEKLFIMTM